MGTGSLKTQGGCFVAVLVESYLAFLALYAVYGGGRRREELGFGDGFVYVLVKPLRSSLLFLIYGCCATCFISPYTRS